MTPFTLTDLEAIVAERASAPVGSSYTRSLLERGPKQCAKKMGEEAVETALAATEVGTEHLVAESADLLYHLLVLLRSREVPLSAVYAELERRTVQSGLEEKAKRPKV